MEVKNCKGCGRIFNYMDGEQLCPACKKKLEEKFSEVKKYIEDNPDATVKQVSEDMDVSVKQIKLWIRQERLILSKASPDGILCESCGRPIRSGKFCDKCKTSMQNKLANALDKPKGTVVEKVERDGSRMRFL